MRFYKLFYIFLAVVLCSIITTSCGIYSFTDVSIDYTKYKTIKIGFIENRARYVNPQLSNKLTDKVQQKFASQTKLIRTNNDDAHLQLSGYITNYDPSQTVGISNQQTTTNRLVVTVHLILKDIIKNKTHEFDVTRNFDFSASSTLQEVEAKLIEESIVPSITDEIFNQLFSQIDE